MTTSTHGEHLKDGHVLRKVAEIPSESSGYGGGDRTSLTQN